MSARRINTKELIEKIEQITKAKMAEQEVVSLDDYRELKKKLSPKVILIIEDDETMRNSLKRIFEGEGYLVKLISDGTQLSGVLDESTIDLILLDIGLPWINGFELGELLKQHKILRHIPLVYCSGNTNDEDVKKAFQLGADDYIKKPFDIDKIKKSVRTLLKLNN